LTKLAVGIQNANVKWQNAAKCDVGIARVWSVTRKSPNRASRAPAIKNGRAGGRNGAARKIDLAGEVEEAAEYLYQNGIPTYACSTELPVEVLGAKYKWARGAGLI
jgi:hypothetical protein